jgi:hypothetical protein
MRAAVAVGVEFGAHHDVADLHVDHLHPMTGLLGLLGVDADGRGLGVGEEHLRNRMMVGGRRVHAPCVGVQRFSGEREHRSRRRRYAPGTCPDG